MNSRTQRILILAGALLVVLVAASLVLNSKREHDLERATNGGAADQRITALKRGSHPPKSEQPEDPVGEPVEANALNLLAGKTMLEVTPEEVERVLDAGGRGADLLIAAQAALGDDSYLREAAESDPDNPEVQFWILANRVLPEERTAWLGKFKTSDPDNALGNYLAAQEAFRSGDFAAGISELKAAGEKGYRDYSDHLQDHVQKLYDSSGKFDETAARNGSAQATSMPHIDQIQSLSQRLLAHHNQLLADDKPAEAAELAELGIGMLETVAGNSGADAIGSRTMMLFMQENLLRAAGDPNGTLERLTAERERVGQLGESMRQIFARGDLLGPAQLDGYAERLHDLGEVGAAEWLVEQVGELSDEE